VRIPTNIITGFLGVGKTSAILDLLARKPAGERWAVLVNEYGEVSVDHAILEGGGNPNVTVQEVAGGCICCATAPYLQVALYLLLTEAKPHRLIVETTGLGHPSRLVELLNGPAYQDRLELRATLTILSPDDFTTPKMLENPIFQEQVDIADVLVLNKSDRANPETIQDFQNWANKLSPPKMLIVATQNGQLDDQWLDLVSPQANSPLTEVSEIFAAAPPVGLLPSPRQPIRRESSGSIAACGWIFSPEDVFDESKLLELLSSWSAGSRAKGIFRFSDGSVIINRVGNTLTCQKTNYSRDSRLELFADNSEPMGLPGTTV
jgi:G3E family GTPase